MNTFWCHPPWLAPSHLSPGESGESSAVGATVEPARLESRGWSSGIWRFEWDFKIL